MKTLSASKAAEAVGKSIPTITRAIKSGKLSATKLDGGGYEIDPAELFRVWPAVKRNGDAKGQMSGHETPIVTSDLQAKLDVAEAKLAASEKRYEDAAATIEDLRARLDAESEERRALSQRLLPAPQEAPQKRKGFFGWLGSRTA